ADHERDSLRLLAEVHEQVAGLLGGPFPGGVQGDAEDADAPGRVLEHGQDVSPGAAGQAGREEVAGQDRLGLGAQELHQAGTGPPRRGAGAVGLEDLPDGRRRDVDSQAGQFPVDPAVAPVGVVAGQPEDQGPDGLAGGRPAGPAAHGPRRPAAPDDVAVPAQDRVRGDQKPQPVATGFGYHAGQWPRAGPGPPSSASGGAAAAAAGPQAGGAGSGSRRFSTPPRVGTAAAMRLAAWSGGTGTAGT